MAKVAVLGMGAMGSRMAVALLRAGHEVAVWNRSSERTAPLVALGARAADTPRAAVAAVDFAISMVRDDDASRTVWLDPAAGALVGMPEPAVAIESSTLTPAWVRALAEHCRRHGVAFLDAPVTGSRPQADAAQLIYFVGGDAAVLARTEPLLKAMGSTVHHAGPVGSATAIKLAVNALFAVQVATLAEMLALLGRNGLDAARAVEIIASTPVCSPTTRAAAAAMQAQNYAPMFPVDLAEKDLGTVLAQAALDGVPVPMAEAVRRVFAQAVQQGYGADNITGVARLYTPHTA